MHRITKETNYIKIQLSKYYFKNICGDFPGSPVVKTSASNTGGVGLIPGQGAKIPHASWPKKPKQKQYCNKFNKDFKSGPHQKKTKKIKIKN